MIRVDTDWYGAAVVVGVLLLALVGAAKVSAGLVGLVLGRRGQ